MFTSDGHETELSCGGRVFHMLWQQTRLLGQFIFMLCCTKRNRQLSLVIRLGMHGGSSALVIDKKTVKAPTAEINKVRTQSMNMCDLVSRFIGNAINTMIADAMEPIVQLYTPSFSKGETLIHSPKGTLWQYALHCNSAQDAHAL